jgi:hypothetical protein
MVYFRTNEVDNVNIKSCEAAACRAFGIDPKEVNSKQEAVNKLKVRK